MTIKIYTNMYFFIENVFTLIQNAVVKLFTLRKGQSFYAARVANLQSKPDIISVITSDQL